MGRETWNGELEIIALAALGASIDDLVNRSLLACADAPRAAEIGFPTPQHQQLFSQLFADFVAPMSSALFGSQQTALLLLTRICDRPHFNDEHTVAYLEEPVSLLADWLQAQVVVDIWLPSVNRRVDLHLTRVELIEVCGTGSRHGLRRLTRTAERFATILSRHAVQVSEHHRLSALDELHDRFHDDALGEHAGVIVQMLNDVRWGMWDYLYPTFVKASPKDAEALEYTYRYPAAVVSEFARSCFWDVMNDVRRQPLLGRFRSGSLSPPRY